jgi:hypothetical protein
MFGNLRISDITTALAMQLRDRAMKAVTQAADSAPPILAREVNMPDSGRYLIDWLDKDVASALRARQGYTSNVSSKVSSCHRRATDISELKNPAFDRMKGHNCLEQIEVRSVS